MGSEGRSFEASFTMDPMTTGLKISSDAARIGADEILNHNTGSGYDALEIPLSGQYTLKRDVYSFGVVILELLSGHKPFDSSKPRSKLSLVRWATP